MNTIRIRSNAKQILTENYNVYKRECDSSECISLREYVEIESFSEPSFFNFLFDDYNFTDLTDEHERLYKEFLETL